MDDHILVRLFYMMLSYYKTCFKTIFTAGKYGHENVPFIFYGRVSINTAFPEKTIMVPQGTLR